MEESPEALRRFAEILVAMAEEIDRIRGLIWDLGNEQQDPRVDGPRLGAREPGRRPLPHGDRRPLQDGRRRTPIEILKWKEIYEGLEDACDACKDFTHVLGNMVIKNA